MTDQFYTALKARLAELVADLRYLHKPTDAMIAPQIIDLMLPRTTEQVQEAEEYPFVRWLVYEGEFHRSSPAPFRVLLDAGIYTDLTPADGNAAISELCRTLGRIIERQTFAPFVLANPVRFVIGTPDAEQGNPGLQPHPYYHCRLYLEFQVVNGHQGA